MVQYCKGRLLGFYLCGRFGVKKPWNWGLTTTTVVTEVQDHLSFSEPIKTLIIAVFPCIQMMLYIFTDLWICFLSFLQVFGSWLHSFLTRFQCSAMSFCCLFWSSLCSVSLACNYGKESWEIDVLPASLKIQPSSIGKAHNGYRVSFQLDFCTIARPGLVIWSFLVHILHLATARFDR